LSLIRKWDVRVREQAATVAEYLALARSLGTEQSTPDQYLRANQLAWELTLWLPTDVYRLLSKAILHPTHPKHDMEVLIAVRRTLLAEKAGNLDSGEVLMHGPGFGKHRTISKQ
jgi:hypothetical protein